MACGTMPTCLGCQCGFCPREKEKGGEEVREERGKDGGKRLGITLGSTQSIVSAVSRPIITSCTRVYSSLAMSSDLTATLSLPRTCSH